MTETSAIDTFRQLGLNRELQTQRDNELGQDDFLLLMTTQMKNQDPLKPLDSTAFVAQLAQFSTVSGITELQNIFQNVAGALSGNQMLDAAVMVGKNVLVEGQTAHLGAEGDLEGAVELESGGDVVIQVADSSGRLVRRIEMPAQSAGMVEFSWDGKDGTGARMPPGSYTVTAQYRNGAATEQLPTLVSGRVDSVSTGQQGLILNLAGMGSVGIDQIRRIS